MSVCLLVSLVLAAAVLARRELRGARRACSWRSMDRPPVRRPGARARKPAAARVEAPPEAAAVGRGYTIGPDSPGYRETCGPLRPHGGVKVLDRRPRDLEEVRRRLGSISGVRDLPTAPRRSPAPDFAVGSYVEFTCEEWRVRVVAQVEDGRGGSRTIAYLYDGVPMRSTITRWREGEWRLCAAEGPQVRPAADCGPVTLPLPVESARVALAVG